MSEVPEELVKITSGGTISIPKQFRRYLEMQKRCVIWERKFWNFWRWKRISTSSSLKSI